MSEWKEMQLGDAITLQRGYDLTKKNQKQGKIPVISSSGQSGYHNVAKTSGPGVITGRYGTIGQVYYIEEDFWPHNTTLFVKEFKGNHRKFVYYLLKKMDFVG
ncbi:restriction endonuclease subunit S, partial [Anaerolineales bacterium HSG6]|nr:restriction endonuclease subunit S [Anaerolineales bacterium HSG6]